MPKFNKNRIYNCKPVWLISVKTVTVTKYWQRESVNISKDVYISRIIKCLISGNVSIETSTAKMWKMSYNRY